MRLQPTSNDADGQAPPRPFEMEPNELLALLLIPHRSKDARPSRPARDSFGHQQNRKLFLHCPLARKCPNLASSEKAENRERKLATASADWHGATMHCGVRLCALSKPNLEDRRNYEIDVRGSKSGLGIAIPRHLRNPPLDGGHPDIFGRSTYAPPSSLPTVWRLQCRQGR